MTINEEIWTPLNKRRTFLIECKGNGGLSEDEQAELTALNALPGLPILPSTQALMALMASTLDCRHNRTIFIEGSRGSDFRHDVTVCASCGRFHIFAEREGVHFQITFNLWSNNSLIAASQTIRGLYKGDFEERLSKPVWKPLDLAGLRLYHVVLSYRLKTDDPPRPRYKHYTVAAARPRVAAELVEREVREAYDSNPDISSWHITGYPLEVLQPLEWTENGICLLNEKAIALLGDREHPEHYCHRCGGRNIGWYADSDLWNRLNPPESIICPICFVIEAEAADIKSSAWRVAPGDESDEASRLMTRLAEAEERVANIQRERDEEKEEFQGAYDALLEAYRLHGEAAAVAERLKIIDWLHRRCDYGPPCGRCTYCTVALNIEERSNSMRLGPSFFHAARALRLHLTELIGPQEAETAAEIEARIERALEASTLHFRNAIRLILSQVGDDLCWMDVYKELGALVGIDFKPEILPREQMLANCERFVDSLQAGDAYKPIELAEPVPMILHCPKCGAQHIDAPEPERGWTNPPHKSHLCHSCGVVFRPADVATTGVASIATRGSNDTWPEK